MNEIKLKYKKYPQYKDSGVEWLGEIPVGWKKIKIKFLIKSKTGYAFPSSKFLLPKNDGIPVVRISDVGLDGKVTLENCPKLPYKFYDYLEKYGINKEDILFAMTGGTIGKVATYLGSEKALLNQRVCSFTISNRDLRKLVLFWMNSTFWKKHIDLFASGGAQPNISDTDVLNLQIASPPLPEQTAIANFLDDKTDKIDRAVAQKEKLITLLKERKQIIIQNAVTKGLNPNVKLKESGVEWIGEIPEHWEVKKIFGLCRFVRGNSTFSKDELLDKGEYVALQYGKSYKVSEVDENYEFYVNKEFYKNSQVVNHGDTIIISTSETIEDLGHTVFYNRNDLGLIGGEQILLKPYTGTVNSKYLHFSSKVFSKELRKYATGIKVFRFNINDLKTIYTPILPLTEQKQIVTYIEEQSVKIDKAISLQQKQIEKLKEYKTVLIDNAVTGKIKVI